MGVPPVKDTRPRNLTDTLFHPPKKNPKKTLAPQKNSASFIFVLGGTTARCSIRCGGL